METGGPAADGRAGAGTKGGLAARVHAPGDGGRWVQPPKTRQLRPSALGNAREPRHRGGQAWALDSNRWQGGEGWRTAARPEVPAGMQGGRECGGEGDRRRARTTDSKPGPDQWGNRAAKETAASGKRVRPGSSR